MEATMTTEPLQPNREELEKQVQAGMTTRDLASHYGYTNSGSIWYYIKKYEIEIPKSRKHNSFTRWTPKKIEKLKEYVADRMTAEEIAEKFEVSRDAIYNQYKIHGIVAPKPNDFLQDTEPTERQHQIVLGTLLGDGHIRGDGNIMALTHGPKQLEYLNWKAKELEPFFEPRDAKFRSSAPHKNGKNYPGYYHISHAHPVFGKYRTMFYNESTKIVTREILNQLQPLALAVWYMDDGTKMGKLCSIATNSFTHNECQMVVDFLSWRYKLDARINNDKDNKRVAVIPTATRPKFFDLIREYIHPTMMYKLEA